MRLWDLPPRLRRATEAKCVAEESLHRGPEGPLCKSVKVKPGLFGYYMRLEMPEPKDTCQATDMEWKQPKGQKCAVNKAGGWSHLSPLTSDSELQHLELSLLGFQSGFSPALPG